MESFPPGTQQIKDDCGKDLVLSPQPTNDTNQPLVCSSTDCASRTLTKSTELERLAEDSAHDPAMSLHHDGVCYVCRYPTYFGTDLS